MKILEKNRIRKGSGVKCFSRGTFAMKANLPHPQKLVLDNQKETKGISYMAAGIRLVTASPAWKALEAHYQKVRDLHLRNLFADDPKRGERMTRHNYNTMDGHIGNYMPVVMSGLEVAVA